MEENICQNCTLHLLDPLLNTPQLFEMTALLILKSLISSYLRLYYWSSFLFLHLENPFIQKQVGKLYKTDVMQQK